MIRGWVVLVLLALPALPAWGAPRSGREDAGPQVRAMQDDDTQNPAFLWVQQGEALWAAGGKSCADCHGAPGAMRGVAARYPMFDARTGGPMTLWQRVNRCRVERQGAAALAPESEAMLALTALVGLQSRGLPVAVEAEGAMAPFVAEGEALFNRRQGQLNLSCANCHEERAGRHLGGAVIPEGHANAYPLYRLEWQAMGSLARRLRACLIGVRAEPYAAGSAEAVALEVYLGVRGKGLVVETPGVRP